MQDKYLIHICTVDENKIHYIETLIDDQSTFGDESLFSS